MRAAMEDPRIRNLALEDGRYSPAAFLFLLESLQVAVKLAGKEALEGTERHVTGQQVLSGMREHALAQFGPLAAQVWRSWGVRTTLDWGKVVFLLVDNGLLNRQESDTIEDFRDGFDFDEAFVRDYEVETAPGLEEEG
jgi:uncharacterized repeat protein (TIGR04138 family)